MRIVFKSFLVLFAFVQLAWSVDRTCGKSLASEGVNTRLGIQDQIIDLKQQRERVRADIAVERAKKAELRPFAQRERLRQHLFQKYGESWLNQGTELLEGLARSDLKRSELSPSDLELVDGTLLYTVLDRCFEGADLADDKSRVALMESELRLLQLDVEITELSVQLGSARESDKIAQDKSRIEEIEKTRKLAQDKIKDAQSNIARIDALLDRLRRVKAYDVYRLNVGRFAPNISDFWRGLRYSEVPYPQ
ncbi:MAG: hypothetical protein R3A80_03505 [Bdellovibrionota bacterium]